MFYKDAKVYSDGSHYIAIPHTSNPCKRKRVVETPVEVPEDVQTINISSAELETQEIMSQEIKDEWDFTDMTPVKSDDMPFDVESPKPKKKYVVTFTYDDTKHDEMSFRKKLINILSLLQSRKGWRYMGVWERAPKTKRLHFHGLFYIPEGTIPGNMIEKKDFNLNTHKMQLTLQSEYFNSRFGRNDFERIDDNLVKIGNAMAYILKYIEKTHEKIVYSRKLPVYLISDIDENDVLCGIGIEEKKLLLQDKFMCYNEGEQIGVISQKTKTRLRTSN